MNPRMIVGVAVALGLVLALQLLRRTEPPSAAPDSAAVLAASPEVLAGDGGRGADDAPVESPGRRPQSLAVASPEQGPERAPLPGETPLTPMAQLLRDRGREVPPEMLDVERAFAAESVDASWADGAEADILGKFAQRTGLKLIDLQVECRSTMCRLQMAQSSPQEGVPPLPGLMRSVDLEPRFLMSVMDSYGTLNSVAYLPRESPAADAPHPVVD